MQEYCHRCGGDLTEATAFCPHCGAPQLTLAYEQQSQEPATEAGSTGATPPPRPRQVDWRAAVRCAAVVAAIGAALVTASWKLALLSAPSMLWLLSASLITLGLYQKQRPTAWMDARIGARIGLLVGLCLAVGLAASLTGCGLVERYVLHSMGSFDATFAARMVMAQQQAQQWMTTQSVPMTPELSAFERSPEFRAGVILLYAATGTVMLLFISLLGGVFGGLLRTRRN